MAEYTQVSNYGYTPSLAWTATFVSLFGLAALIHTVLAIRSKYWLILPTLVLGSLIECMGWAARLWSNKNVLLLTPFLMQICTLIMAPVFFSAYDYSILGLAISKLGPQYSLLRPSWYFAIFITADIISLVLQAVGGGQAAASAGTSAPTQTATDIMVAGIIFQLIVMAIFMGLGVDFVLRASSKRPYAFRERQVLRELEKKREKEASANAGTEKLHAPASQQRGSSGSIFSENTAVNTPGTTTPIAMDSRGAKPISRVETDAEALRCHGEGGMTEKQLMKRWWIFLVGVGISSLMVIVRGVFRSIELSQGWSSRLVETENFQNLLDGLPMLIAVYIYIPFHPLFLLPARTSWKGIH